MKPIEKGCMAIVTNGAQDPKVPTNIGKIVTVGKFLGRVEGVTGDDIWEVDQKMFLRGGGVVYCNLERNLQRIDDDSEESNIKTEEEITSEV